MPFNILENHRNKVCKNYNYYNYQIQNSTFRSFVFHLSIKNFSLFSFLLSLYLGKIFLHVRKTCFKFEYEMKIEILNKKIFI